MQVSSLLERLAKSGSKVQLFEILRALDASITLFPPGVPLCVKPVRLGDLRGGAWLGSFFCKEDGCMAGAGGEAFIVPRGSAWLVRWPPIAVWTLVYRDIGYVTFDAADSASSSDDDPPCGEFSWDAMKWSGDCSGWMVGESDVFHAVYGGMEVMLPYPLAGTVYKDDVFGAYLFVTDPPEFPVGPTPPAGRRPRFAIYITAYSEESGEESEEGSEERIYIYPIPLPDRDIDPASIISSMLASECRGMRGITTRVYGILQGGTSPEPEEEGGDEHDVDDGDGGEDGDEDVGELSDEEEGDDYEKPRRRSMRHSAAEVGI
jgi:hypothetical protein